MYQSDAFWYSRRWRVHCFVLFFSVGFNKRWFVGIDVYVRERLLVILILNWYMPYIYRVYCFWLPNTKVVWQGQFAENKVYTLYGEERRGEKSWRLRLICCDKKADKNVKHQRCDLIHTIRMVLTWNEGIHLLIYY